MDLIEEERRIQEEKEWRDFEHEIFSDKADVFVSDRDLAGKGKEVNPSGKQWKIVNMLASTIKLPSEKKLVSSTSSNTNVGSAEHISTLKDFDLTSKHRILINQGYITKYEIIGNTRKSSKKYFFLFTDVLLVTVKKELLDQYDLQSVIWVKDMKLSYCDVDNEHMNDTLSNMIIPHGGSISGLSGRHSITSNSVLESDNDDVSNLLSFQIISTKARSKLQSTYYFLCDTEDMRKQLVEDIENVILAYHHQVSRIKPFGWFHDLILGNFHSAAATGDVATLRKYIRHMELNNIPMDVEDNAGMTALHWAVLREHETCVRLLLQHGGDPNKRNIGSNTAILLASCRGNDAIVRLLLEFGAELTSRNMYNHDVIYMTVIYGNKSKNFPWLLQLYTNLGFDLNQLDRNGASPLHHCAEKNINRPVRQLIDLGVDVNMKHGQSQLTALQIACSQSSLDAEMIRILLDKGAHPNSRDSQNRTALELILQNHKFPSRPAMIEHTTRNSERLESTSSDPNALDPKWRGMEETLEQVGIFASRVLPVILEIIKKGGKFNSRDFENIRPSFRNAILEARTLWENKSIPSNFSEFLLQRDQSGDEVRLQKSNWMKDKSSNVCSCCGFAFNMQNRRHHCRAGGELVCDACSTKRMPLDSSFPAMSLTTASPMSSKSSPPPAPAPEPKKRGLRLSLGRSSKPAPPSTPPTISSSASSYGDETPPPNSSSSGKGDRVCDSCFNRLCYEASQPVPEQARVKQLKQSAQDLIDGLSDLLELLDTDPSFLTDNGPGSPSKSKRMSGSPMRLSMRLSLSDQDRPQSLSLVELINVRQDKLTTCENIASKFSEVARHYHKEGDRVIHKVTISNNK